MANSILRVTLAAAAIALFASTPSRAQVACAYDAPCISRLFISTTDALVARIDGSAYDVINVRWSRPGREGNQTEHPGRNAEIVVLKGTTAGVTYTVSTQGCKKRPLQSSRCSDWTSSSIKAY